MHVAKGVGLRSDKGTEYRHGYGLESGALSVYSGLDLTCELG